MMPARVDLLDQDAGRIEAFELLVVVFAAELLEVPPRQAVLHGKHHGVGAEQVVDVLDHLVEEMRLHGENDEVLLAGVGGLVDRLDLGGLHLAVMPFELEAVLLDGIEMRARHVDHGDLVAGERELGGHQAADGAGADHADAHRLGLAEQIGARQFLIETVGERADAVDHDLDKLLASRITPAPSEVPQAITSPGISVMSRETTAHQLVGREEHVADRIILPLLTVHHGADAQLHRIDAGRDHRADHAERVEALGARPTDRKSGFFFSRSTAVTSLMQV